MANDTMRDFWANAADPWVRHQRIYDAELQGFAQALEEALPVRAGMRLLDIGCGTGTLLERAVGIGATGVGVDISTAMITAATQRVPSARFAVADAQSDDLSALGPFDAAISRFGVMFFDNPVAAFANIRGALAPGAPLAFACWRGPEENLMFSLGTSLLLDRMDPRPAPPRPGAPGPMGLADPDLTRSILNDAGWTDIDIAPLDVVCDYGIDGSDGVEERMIMVLGNSTARAAAAQLEPELGPELWAALLDEIRAELRRHFVDGRVQFNGAAWLVTARA